LGRRDRLRLSVPGHSWHINGQFRYGQAKGSKDVASSFSLIQPPPDTSFSFSSATTANLKERHWIVDFGGGYDIFPAASNRPALLQANFGIRIAEIKATNRVDTSGSLFVSDGVDTTTASFSQSDKDVRSFLGLGPRVGVEGAIPLWGAFGFDYAANVALLWGHSKINFDSVSAFTAVSTDVAGPTVVSASGLTSGSQWSKTSAVWSADVQVGVSYWFTSNMKVGVSYRLDAFLAPLHAFPSNDPAVIDRYYHGPKVTLTGVL
jgi:opacity protein-like surface antigen